jgi:hypothetical protein
MAPTRARKQKSKQFSSPQLYGLDVDHKWKPTKIVWTQKQAEKVDDLFNSKVAK